MAFGEKSDPSGFGAFAVAPRGKPGEFSHVGP